MYARSPARFANCDAADFIEEVKADGPPAVLNAFEVIEYLKPDEQIEAPHGGVDRNLCRRAATSMRRVLGANSELGDQWRATDSFEAWKADVLGLLERLK